MIKITLHAPLVQVQSGRMDLRGMTDPTASKKGWRVYSNECWGKIAYAFGFAIKAEFKNKDGTTKVWYINKNSFAKRSTNTSFFTGQEVKAMIAKIRSKHSLPKISNLPPNFRMTNTRGVDGPVKDYAQEYVVLEKTLKERVESYAPSDTNYKRNQVNYFAKICKELKKVNFDSVDEMHKAVSDAMQTWNKRLHAPQNTWALHYFNNQEKNGNNNIFSTSSDGIESNTSLTLDEVSQPVDDFAPKEFALLQNRLEKKLLKFASKNLPYRDKQIDFFKKICDKLSETHFKSVNDLHDAVDNAMHTWSKQFGAKPNDWALHHYGKGSFHDIFVANDDASTVKPVTHVYSSASVALGSSYPWVSDHLPIGVNFNFCGQPLGIASYNILHEDYKHHFDQKKNSQGLWGSPITALPEVERKKRIIDQLVNMLNHKTHPKHFIGLQECDPKMRQMIEKKFDELRQNGQGNFQLLWPDDKSTDAGPCVYNADVLEVKLLSRIPVTSNKYFNDFWISVLDSNKKPTNKHFRIVNCHLAHEKEDSVNDYLIKKTSHLDNAPMFLIGDMNTSTDSLEKSIFPNDIFVRKGCSTKQLTHIGTDRKAADYDQIHYIYVEALKEVTLSHLKLSTPKEMFDDPAILEDFDKTIKVLKTIA